MAEHWTKEWIEEGIIAAEASAAGGTGDVHYLSFLAFLGGWLSQGGLGQGAKDALDACHKAAREVAYS